MEGKVLRYDKKLEKKLAPLGLVRGRPHTAADHRQWEIEREGGGGRRAARGSRRPGRRRRTRARKLGKKLPSFGMQVDKAVQGLPRREILFLCYVLQTRQPAGFCHCLGLGVAEVEVPSLFPLLR